MTSKGKESLTNRHPQRERGTFDFGNALAIGISLGLVLGTALGNIAMGLTGGLLLATLANAYHLKRQNEKHADLALGISLAALVLLLVIWAFSL